MMLTCYIASNRKCHVVVYTHENDLMGFSNCQLRIMSLYLVGTYRSMDVANKGYITVVYLRDLKSNVYSTVTGKLFVMQLIKNVISLSRVHV